MGIGIMELIVMAACPLTMLVGLAAVIVIAIASRRRPNLINCPDCGHGVSPAATACPHCGRPMA